MINRLIKLLEQVELDMSAAEIADALWLASQMKPLVVNPVEDTEQPINISPQPRVSQSIENLFSPPLIEKPKEIKVSAYTKDDISQISASEILTPSSLGLPFKAPATSALSNYLEIGRSLRPLKRKVPSRTKFVLDEESTVQQIAEYDMWIPVLKPAREHWLDLVLVIEEIRTTVVWEETITEFRKLMERHGAFRNVYTWSLQTSVDGKPQLLTHQGKVTKKQYFRSPKELLEPNGRRLILLISDCISSLWWQGEIHKLLKLWEKQVPVTVLQLLPEQLWERTVLGLGSSVPLSAFAPGLINSKLTVNSLPLWLERKPTNALQFPVVTLEPESLADWARVFVGRGNIETLGVLFMPNWRELIPTSQLSILQASSQELSDPKLLVKNFYAIASPLARQLANLMASAPVSLPVINIIQRKMLPESRQIHIAEIFMSGLLKFIPVNQQNQRERWQYKFVNGVRQVLLRSVRRSEIDAVLEAISQYIANKAGLEIKSFAALLVPNPNCDEKLQTEIISFAEITMQVLRQLGEEYAVLAEQLVQESSVESETQTPKFPSGEIKKYDISQQYRNANVVLLGESGVGKSGLSLVLTDREFRPTELTHSRHVWTFDTQKLKLSDDRQELREILLWDLAGQPGYRLIHQLYLNELAVALIVFDARSETEPFAGVYYWNRALREAQNLPGNSAIALKKFLVSARVDRGGIGVTKARINALVSELGFDGYFETSAKEGLGIKELATAIRNAIDWEHLPKVISTELFQKIKVFLIQEKKSKRLLSQVDDLYRAFLQSNNALADSKEMQDKFEICIRLVESQDLIRRLSFGNLILLQPEVLDAYASAIINAAKDEPEGMGCIVEEDLLAGRFRMQEDERIADKEQEKLLLIATVEELLTREIALREQTEAAPLLVFPSQFTREWPEAPDPEGKAVIFEFEGAVLNVYTTLVVRLSRSEIFKCKEMWKNAAMFTAKVGECGMWLRHIEEGKAELTLFFKPEASEETRLRFEEYVHTHLKRRALPESIRRRRIFVCSDCETPVTELQAIRRRERDFNWIDCSVCGTRISLLDGEERLTADRTVIIPQMDKAADKQREIDTATSIIQGKVATDDFDMFLCHNTQDKPLVEAIAKQLRQRGLNPWLDNKEIRAGKSFQYAIQEGIQQVKSAAIFISLNGLGKWQLEELRSLNSRFVNENLPLIPVLLPGVTEIPNDPKLLFLKELNWVRFVDNVDEKEPLEQLIARITGINSLNC
ncbi:SAV_2336 N-terminal domain-related protein [Nostoc sp. ChiQUE01b]|uniref:SAV_2336 N-terminal domain-related protein n=1 Tax=Nostoc sp. ChiQUE01b TaxID=3075376 RepID=UPI002AD31474|nr:SAV_2336 N-terminal domain-related protein [Nostoc sp. ChiQUE01b]MDZ8259606.1 SAV_2336 N-terminal domain-related protein [Nostoc sp. ChiQUE01b]